MKCTTEPLENIIRIRLSEEIWMAWSALDPKPTEFLRQSVWKRHGSSRREMARSHVLRLSELGNRR